MLVNDNEKVDLYEEKTTATNKKVWMTLYELEKSYQNKENENFNIDYFLSLLENLKKVFDESLVFPLEFVKVYHTTPILLNIATDFSPNLSQTHFEIWKISLHILCFHFCRNEICAEYLYTHGFMPFVLELLPNIELSNEICVPLIYSLSILTRINPEIINSFLTHDFIILIEQLQNIVEESGHIEVETVITYNDKHNFNRVIFHLLTTIIWNSNESIEPLIYKSFNEMNFIFDEEYEFNEIEVFFDALRQHLISENLIKETNIIQVSRDLLNNEQIKGESFIAILRFLKSITDSFPLYNDLWNADLFHVLTKFKTFEMQFQDNFLCILEQIIIESVEILNSFLSSNLFEIVVELLSKEEFLLRCHSSILLMLCVIMDNNCINKCCLETNLLEKLESLYENDNPFIQNILISFLIPPFSHMSSYQNGLQQFQQQTGDWIFDFIDELLEVDDDKITEKALLFQSLINEIK